MLPARLRNALDGLSAVNASRGPCVGIKGACRASPTLEASLSLPRPQPPRPQAMGGHFSSLMPSDLSGPGALAFESIPAVRGEEYARPGVRRELTRMFKRDGCHHCGAVARACRA